ncbi:hypothetical protein AVEN_202487-1 [Araneus ventricosus]|uniref:Uncharacterized protein n=1 Tax=Araneus ventricosus TaxID=182803 RepID=A0A4Y2S047_ARAVE|nr:hypothetical protein AVEN_265995-1 [Araneus ventricosus]GBN80986.1 hypothetical protein AVEN_202487-1 [Araneus ventricosus]
MVNIWEITKAITPPCLSTRVLRERPAALTSSGTVAPHSGPHCERLVRRSSNLTGSSEMGPKIYTIITIPPGESGARLIIRRPLIRELAVLPPTVGAIYGKVKTGNV